MISVNYINNIKQEPLYFSPLVKLEREMDEIINEVEVAYQEYVSAVNVYELDATFLEKDEVDDKKKADVEEKGKNFVSSIGAAVINIFKKAIAFVTDLLSKIKEKFGSNKEKFSKAEAICKQNPKLNKYLTDEVKEAIDRGDMNITDIRALAELDKEYESLVEMSKKKDVNPDSLKAKWEAAKKKFEGASKHPIIAGVAGIAAVITGITAASTAINRNKTDLNDAMANMIDWGTHNNAGDFDNKGPVRIIADAARYNTHAHIVASNEANSIATFLANCIDNVLRQVSPNTYQNLKDRQNDAAQQHVSQRDHEARVNNTRNARDNTLNAGQNNQNNQPNNQPTP